LVISELIAALGGVLGLKTEIPLSRIPETVEAVPEAEKKEALY
jgi:hypothetical protein